MGSVSFSNNFFKTYSSYLVKIFFLAFGLADFLGFLPNSLDLVDKILTSVILFLFWLELKPSKFIFGKRKKWLDYSILFTFYILVIDTFVNFIRLIDLSDLFVRKTGEWISQFSFLHLGDLLIRFFLYLHNPANASTISFVSIVVGFSFLLLLVLYSALKMTYGAPSVMRSFFYVFSKKESVWKNFADTEGSSVVVKFFLSLIVLFSIYQYFFSLIIQWFVVSLDKALFIFAIIYAVKDIRGTKSSFLNKVGSFDELFLGFIKNIFTSKKKFFLGFSILLLFHFLSDLATFFLPYFFGFISIDSFYLQYLGDSSSSLHRSVSLLSQADISSFAHSVFQAVSIHASYVVSALGVFLLLILPMFFLYAYIFKLPLRKSLNYLYVRMIVHFSFFSVFVFLLAPWVAQKVISATGIQGVDFITQQISRFMNPIFGVFVFLALFIFAQLLTLSKRIRSRLSSYMILFLFLTSMVYFGTYIFHYFISSLHYHISSIVYFFSQHAYFGVLIFSFMLLIEFLFYIGGFLLLVYHLSSFVIKDIFIHLFSEAFVLFWTALLVIVPLFLLLPSTVLSFRLASVAIFVFLIFTYRLYKILGSSEKRDDYLLSLTAIVALYQLVLILQLAFVQVGVLSQGVFNFISSFVVAGLAFGVMRFFSFKKLFHKPAFRNVLRVLFFSIIFGLVFFVLGEPVPSLWSYTLPILILYTFAVSFGEEVLFRGVLYRLARQSFSEKKALHVQAFVFAGIHFTGFAFLYNYFTVGGSQVLVGIVSLVAYFVALYWFALVAGRLVHKRRSLLLPVLFHWLVNLVAILLSLSFA